MVVGTLRLTANGKDEEEEEDNNRKNVKQWNSQPSLR
jgi:hypothetical protein